MHSESLTRIENSLLPYHFWESRAQELAEQYRSQLPFPHVHLVGLLDDAVARELAASLASAKFDWIHYRHYNENTLGLPDRERFPALVRNVVDELQSPRFVDWLSCVTGIPGLLCDPDLEGGGLHQTERGGFLRVHADFSHHPHRARWRRRCNLILYLNERWEPGWGGALELWDEQACIAKYQPLLNDAVVFTTNDTSYHGYPEPLDCPAETPRNSLAIYYYTQDDVPTRPRSTRFRALPGERASTFAIWLDNQLLRVHAWLKRNIGLSDQFVGRLLAWRKRPPRA